jgi:integrase/recombinase XerD
VTHLRKMMLEELQRRNYSQLTIESYLHAVEDFARHFGQSPDQLNQEHIRQYHLHLVHDRKFAVNTIVARIAALRFFFVKTLRRPYQREDLPSPKRPKRLPSVLSQAEVARLIDAAGNLFHYAILMTLYATGLRRAELCRLRVSDIDSSAWWFTFTRVKATGTAMCRSRQSCSKRYERIGAGRSRRNGYFHVEA